MMLHLVGTVASAASVCVQGGEGADGRRNKCSAAKGVFTTVGNVQEAVLVLVILIHIRHESGCTTQKAAHQEDMSSLHC